ncbi:MAG: lipocalin family protein [Myxococcota bacterium]
MVLVFALGCSHAPQTSLQTVSHVDLSRYMGKWYEIARLPNRFQKGCLRSTAEYALKDGVVSVINRCDLEDGSMKEAVGIAQVVDAQTNAKLKVSFLPDWLRWTGFGWGNYWIIDLDDNYEYVVVSEPEQKYLWILSRSQTIKPQKYDEILANIKAQGFDISALIIDKR